MEPTPLTLKDMLLKHFEPADGREQGSMMKSTGDLFNILDGHAPGKFIVNDLYDVLAGNGFQDKLVGDAILWSVKPKAIRS